MEKKYKSGLIVGKFLPPHKGHLFLINTALENAEIVTLLVCSLKNEPIEGDDRFNWLKEIYKGEKRLNIINFKEEVPQVPEEDPNFWDIWVGIARNNCPPDLDVIFTSENYGDPYSEKLGIKHHIVDLDRKTFPTSGTKVRTETFSNWEYIPEQVRPHFVKRIAIMGPESVGKSTMTKKLATYFNTNFVVEYGRLIYEANGNKVTIDDFMPISRGRQSLEDWLLLQSNKLIFCDTEDITTYIFTKMYCPDEYLQVEDWFLNILNTKKKYDLYLLLMPDCKSVQDGTRSFLDSRLEHYEVIKKELIDRGCEFIEIGGVDWNERYQSCIDVVSTNFNV